ncbi:MAG: substrate-binding domain-containing protein [Deferribacteres bacterium]|nr:substrate-binding domain-containing protein [candidate division KSB1 bacterium]MCB9502822.1 substrate-binding domain-containing protein [Deferribacteres bacterium]
MVKKFNLIILAIGLIIQLSYVDAQEKEKFKIIVHESNSITKLSRKKLSRIFLKKEGQWKNGEKITAVDLVENSEIREAFSREIHGKNVSSIKAYWQKQIFTGRDVPLPEKLTEEEVIRYVQENDGAIGYVASATPIEKYHVKVLGLED